MASSFNSSDAELRRDGFLSRARFRKESMERLQSSAMSSRGGACLWICQDRDNGLKIKETLTNPKYGVTQYQSEDLVMRSTKEKGNSDIKHCFPTTQFHEEVSNCEADDDLKNRNRTS